MGSEAFRKELPAQMAEQRGAEHFGDEVHEAAEDKANRVIREELAKLKWKKNALGEQRKGDPRKIRIALRLRKETTMTLAWTAERSRMGIKTYLVHLLYWAGQEK